MSVARVVLACPHCGAKYRVRIDTEKLERMRSRAQCARCKNTFDVAERLIERHSSLPARRPTSPPAPIFPQARRASPTAPPPRPRVPPSPSFRPPSPAPVPTPSRPPPPVERGLGPSEPPRVSPRQMTTPPTPLRRGDLEASRADAMAERWKPAPPPGDSDERPTDRPPRSVQLWTARAVLDLDDLEREPTAGELALERLLD